MAGLGFNAANNMAKSSPRKPMGIQFVKSADTAGAQPTPSFAPYPRQESNVSAGADTKSIPSLMGTQVRPAVQGNSNGGNFASRNPTSSYQTFVKSEETYSSLQSNKSGQGLGYRMPGQINLNKGGAKSGAPSADSNVFQRVADARAVCSVEEYLKRWKSETDPDLAKLRKLAYEVVTLKSDRPNAKDKLHSAANRVPLRIEFNIQPVFGARNNNSFLCYVYIEGVSIASGQGPKIKDAKTNAYENALQKILFPYLRIIPTDPTSKELQSSKEPFTADPPAASKVPLKMNQPVLGKEQVKDVGQSSQHKESNMEAAGLKRRYNEYKPLDEFVIVEPKVPIPDCTAAHTLRRSADFNHMLLEYEYFFKGEAARCVMRIENEVLADVSGASKAAAKNVASIQGLQKLKKFCWVIKTKQAVDSNTKISKEEMLNELNEQSDSINQDNIGNKLLRKMGWSGGGVGKDGSGIAEPVSLKSVLNREGLGLSSSKGVTDEFRRRVKEVIETYAASDNQEDLVFSCDFRLEERQIIHDECRRLNLRSKSRGKGQKRYLCVRRKRSVNQLFDHLMSVGGETARYQLVPPGGDMAIQTENSNSNSGNPGEAPTKPFNSSLANVNETLVTPVSDTQLPGNKQRPHCPVQGNSMPGAFMGRDGGGNRFNAMGNKQGLLGQFPPQNRFPNKSGNVDHSCPSKRPNLQSSGFVRGPGNGSHNNNNMRNRPQHMGSSNFDSFIPNSANDIGFPGQNNYYSNNTVTHPTYNNSPGPLPMENSVQQGPPPPPPAPHGMMNNFPPQNNSYPMNQGRHNMSVPVTRTGFDSNMSRNGVMPSGNGQTSLTSGPMHGMVNQDWNCPDNGGSYNNAPMWGVSGAYGSNNFAHEMEMHPNQNIMQQQGMNMMGNFKPNMRGGFR